MNKTHIFVYSNEVLEFVKTAKIFTDFLDEEEYAPRSEFMGQILKILPAMYSAMMSVPANEPEFDSGNEKHVKEEQWSEIYRKIYSTFASQNEYLDVPEEQEYDRMEVISRDLSEDLSDIYQDIMDFLENFHLGTEEVMNDAVWECRMNFENYWGKKLLRACLNIHKSYTKNVEILEKMDSAFEKKHGGKNIETDEWFISKRQQGGEGNGTVSK